MKNSTCTASTTMWAKKSDSESMIFEDMAVFAAFSSVSLPRLAVSMDRCSSMYRQACNTGNAASQDGVSSLHPIFFQVLPEEPAWPRMLSRLDPIVLR